MPGDGGKYNFNRKEGTHRQCGAAGRIPGGCWRPVTVAAHPLILRFHVVGDEAWLTGCHQPCFSAVSCRESTLERSLSLADQTERGENEHYHNLCRQAVKKIRSQPRSGVIRSSLFATLVERIRVTMTWGGSSRTTGLLWKLTRWL